MCLMVDTMTFQINEELRDLPMGTLGCARQTFDVG